MFGFYFGLCYGRYFYSVNNYDVASLCWEIQELERCNKDF